MQHLKTELNKASGTFPLATGTITTSNFRDILTLSIRKSGLTWSSINCVSGTLTQSMTALENKST